MWAIFFSVQLLHSKGQSLRYLPGLGNPHRCLVALYMGEGSEKEQCCLLCSLPAFSHFFLYPQANWALLVLIPGWVVLCKFWDPVSLSNKLSCEAASFSCGLNPLQVFFYQRFRGFISLHWNPGLHGLSCSPVIPPGSSACKICGTACSTSCLFACPGPPASTLLGVLFTLAAHLYTSYQSG